MLPQEKIRATCSKFVSCVSEKCFVAIYVCRRRRRNRLRSKLRESCLGLCGVIEQQVGFADLADQQTRIERFFVRDKCLTRALEVTKRSLILPFFQIQIAERIAGNTDAIEIAAALVRPQRVSQRSQRRLKLEISEDVRA